MLTSLALSTLLAFTNVSRTSAVDGRPEDLSRGLAARIPFSLTCPVFEFENTTVGGTAATRRTGTLNDNTPMQLDFDPLPAGDFGPLEVELQLQWSPDERVLRKWARYRLSPAGKPALLKTVTLETIDAGQANLITDLTRESVPPDDPQSRPVFLRGLFVGIEFPIAATRVENDQIILAHRPGRRLQPGVWHETRKAVYAPTAPGEERDAFARYLAAHRPGPTGLHVNYNSWWSAPIHYSQNDILKLMRIFEEKLARPFAISFDTFCIDMGWSDIHALWQIDLKTFPEGFMPIQRSAERMNSRLGLWVSPSNTYSPRSFDNAWAAANGYETFPIGKRRAACLAGPRYATAFRERLIEMATRYGVRQFKFDGHRPECPESTHGHEPGALSAEPIAESIIATFTAIHQAAPDAWLETTCFGWNPSPWWLFHVNSIIGTFGNDCPYGRVPCPVYRESYTTSRDFYNLQGAARLSAPIWAQEVLGIIHQDAEPFLNDAIMALMRGHMFLPVYIDPRHMNDARWRTFAEYLRWARRHAAALEHTVPILPAAWTNGSVPKFTHNADMPREPYGYAHRHAEGALIALRNPWIQPQPAHVNLATILGLLDRGKPGEQQTSTDDSTATPAPLAVVSLYPEARLYAEGVHRTDTLEVMLAPYETVVLSVSPKQPVKGLPRAADVIGRAIEANVAKREITPIRFQGPEEPMGPDWTSPIPGPGLFTRLNVNADVLVRAPQAELLILLEDRQTPAIPTYHLTINGAEPTATTSSSAIGFNVASGTRRENWLFLRAPLAAGPNQIRLDLLDNRDPPQASIWVWATRAHAADPADYPDLLPAPELISLDAVKLAALAGMPVPATQPAAVERPITRIDGVFLDALEPVSAAQGYGTLRRNRSVADQPLTIGARRFLRGLGTHAAAQLVYQLDGRYRRFQSWVGADGWTSPTITFEVRVDGQKRWESGLMTRTDPARWVDVDVTNAKTLELLVGDAGNGRTSDHADWAEARLLR